MLNTRRALLCLLWMMCALLTMRGAAAQSTTYRVTGLAASRAGATNVSPSLLNPWGVDSLPGQLFFIAENASGRVDAYDAAGVNITGLTIPAPAGSNAAFSKPTGIAADPEANFGPPGANFQFLVAADNGTIWGFSVVNGIPQPAQLFADLGVAVGGIYTGIAVLHPDCCAPYVAVANFAQGEIITYSGPNTLVSLSRNQFTDPNLPAGYSPFNIQKIGNEVYVTYAEQTGAHLPVPATGAGLIDVYDLVGNFQRRLISPGDALSAPWGITQAGPDFGVYSTALLVGNAGDGTINAFDSAGNYLGTLHDLNGNQMHFVGLRALTFRADRPKELYEVSGADPGQAPDGTLGAITPALETTTVMSAPASAPIGTPVTLAATVFAAAGQPTGTITFFDGAAAIGRQTLDASGSASITLSTLGAGSHGLFAQYVGNFDGSTSSPILLTITAATSTRYHMTPILSNGPGLPSVPDRLLRNPMGLTFVPGGAFWSADNESSNMRVFDETGAAQSPFDIRVARSNGAGTTPTGIAFNPTAGVPAGDFTLPNGTPGQIVVSTNNGVIAGWGTISGEILQVAPIARDDIGLGAVYKGLAIVDPLVSRPYLALADFYNKRVQVYDSTFSPLALLGNYVDPAMPAGYAPFNIQEIGGQVFVTYALQDAGQHEPLKGAGNGLVDIFDLEGHFVRRFATGGVLNAPWGIVQASANFGDFSNDILIGNFGDGLINAFDPVTGSPLGVLLDETGAPLTISGLWGMTFRTDNGSVDPNTLFFTAGTNLGADGLFGSISVTPLTATTTSSVALSFSGNTTVGGIYSMVADVTGAGGTPTGAVSFFEGLTPLGTAPLINGRASQVNTQFLTAGQHTITARYSGDATFLLSKTTAPLLIGGLADTVTLTAPSSVAAGAQVTLMASVTSSQAAPTGTVSFVDGGNTLGTVSLNASGTATLNINTLTVGTHSVVANYSGDSVFAANSSQPATITISIPIPTPVIQSLAPIFVKPGGNGSALTVNGSGFINNSVVMLNGSARATTFVSSTELSAALLAADAANAGTATVLVVNPSPGGNSGNELLAIDTATSTSAALAQPALTVTAGQNATVSAQLSGFTGTVSARCLNAPAGIQCTYSPATNMLTVQSAATTAKGSFALTVVFTGETTVPAQQAMITAAGSLAIPGCLFAGIFARGNRRRKNLWAWIMPLALLLVVVAVGCGGGTKIPPSSPGTTTVPAQSSTGLTVTVQ